MGVGTGVGVGAGVGVGEGAAVGVDVGTGVNDGAEVGIAVGGIAGSEVDEMSEPQATTKNVAARQPLHLSDHFTPVGVNRKTPQVRSHVIVSENQLIAMQIRERVDPGPGGNPLWFSGQLGGPRINRHLP